MTRMSTKEELSAQWVDAAQNWIDRIRSPGGDPSREALLDEWMLREVGDVSGMDVIDLGCGEGRFSRMLAGRGARVTGVDLSGPMIAAAVSAKSSSRETYRVGDMEDLGEVSSDSFDVSVSYITLVDVHDMPAAVREAFRVLRPGGRFIVCNLAPMVTAGNAWVRDENRVKLHFRLDNYFDESDREVPMCGTTFRNVHRTLSTYLNGFIAAGFVLEGIREPFPSVEQLAREPSNEDIFRVPLFIIYLLRKPFAAR
jgi:ubiquinone/menaquinone biosynthesis C-methylase UbiE